MSNLKQDTPKTAEKTVWGEPVQSQARPKFIRWLDSLLDGIYRNYWYSLPPQDIIGQVWGKPLDSPADPQTYFLEYFQSQGYGPTTNECVTTSALMSMNMLVDGFLGQEIPVLPAALFHHDHRTEEVKV